MQTGDAFIAHIINVLRDRKQTVTFAESCTGGMAASRLVDISGSSDVFRQGYITYCDEAKHQLLHVKKETLELYSAVSSQCAMEMAAGAASEAKAEAAVSITGYADGMDPASGLNGLVYIGIYYLGKLTVRENHFAGDRFRVREQARDTAFQMLGEILEQK